MTAPGRNLSAAHLPSLTSLRWFAAGVVFVRHSKLVPWLGVQGITGVSFFFILSGFVIGWSAREGDTPGAFLVRRAARVVPSHLVGIVLAVPVLAATGLLALPADLLPAAVSATLFHAWIPEASYYFGGNPVSWSLSCEVAFYVAFPFVIGPIVGMARRGGGRLLVLAGGAAAVGIAVPLLVGPTAEGSVGYWAVYVNPAFRFVEFLLGVVLSRALAAGRLPRVPLAAAVGLAVATYVIAGRLPLAAMLSATTLVPYALLIVAAAQADLDGRTPSLLGSSWMQRLGRWSFCFYLIHQTVLVAGRGVVNRVSPGMVQWPVMLVCGVVATAGAGAMHVLIEAPVERWARARFLRRAPRTPRVDTIAVVDEP